MKFFIGITTGKKKEMVSMAVRWVRWDENVPHDYFASDWVEIDGRKPKSLTIYSGEVEVPIILNRQDTRIIVSFPQNTGLKIVHGLLQPNGTVFVATDRPDRAELMLGSKRMVIGTFLMDVNHRGPFRQCSSFRDSAIMRPHDQVAK